jgi:primosomal protein N' (replication factor Y)
MYADVILPLALSKLYTYSVPPELQNSVIPGIRVVVQFGKKKIYTAVIFRLHIEPPAEYTTKDIISVIDTMPVLNEHQLRLWQWIANYYMCSLGEVMKAALPAGLKLESETRIIMNPDFDSYSELNEKEYQLVSLLENKKAVSVNEASTILNIRHPSQLVNTLMLKKAVIVEEELKETYKPRCETFVSLYEGITEEQILSQMKILEKAPRQLDALMRYISLSGIFSSVKQRETKKAELIKSTGDNQAINNLIKKNIFRLYEKETGRLNDEPVITKPVNQLNSHQQEAYGRIAENFRDHNVVLLHGVTSSGKTEIYIHLIEEWLKKGKQVLYMLPEIALTTQIINRLKQVFGGRIGVYHSKFSDAERVEIWKNVQGFPGEKSFSVILGVRSSIFLPFSNLGLVIIDEEHENSYKQYNPAPRYNARDSAMILADIHGAKTLVGTATPSVETYHNADTGKYGLVELNHRYLDIMMPEIIVADLAEARRKKKLKSLFTEVLLDNISNSLSGNEQVILFQNRRGFAPYLECPACGWVPKCKNCEVSLTYHKTTGNLLCHYCGFTKPVPASCSACSNPVMQMRSFGTERIEDEIRIFFPEARVARMDYDSTHSRKSYERIINDFENRKIDILVGTQMVSKGLHFDNVNVVGIINADNMLNFPDFRAFERSYQLMAQVSGRAGRKHKRGKVIIQSSDPENPVILDVVDNDYVRFYNQQLKERKEYKYPPFYRIIIITLKSKNLQILNDAAMQFAINLQKQLGKKIYGPHLPLVSKIQNFHLKNILIKIEKGLSVSHIKDIIRKESGKVLADEKFKSVLLLYDVDPL